jgi:CheY-like chemotaxis protein
MPSRVLVVDDDPLICELIEEVLRSAEMESFSLTNSSEAVAHLSREKFGAVFLDVRMPSPDGVELTEQIRTGGLSGTTPIVIVTGDEARAVLARVPSRRQLLSFQTRRPALHSASDSDYRRRDRAGGATIPTRQDSLQGVLGIRAGASQRLDPGLKFGRIVCTSVTRIERRIGGPGQCGDEAGHAAFVRDRARRAPSF